MNIDQMAHEYAKELLKTTHANHGFLSKAELENISEVSWELVDLMQAESDKRKPKGLPEVLFEPDWSQAPERAEYWTMNDDGKAQWHFSKPFIPAFGFWASAEHSVYAPSFNYQGDWKNSLRKRP
jgi:hypothetical protein